MNSNSKIDIITLSKKYDVESLIQYCRNYIESPLIQLAGEYNLEDFNIAFHFALISKKAISSSRKKIDWDIRIDQGFPYLDRLHNGRVKYFPSGTNPIIPLVYYREIPGKKPFPQIYEDFILINNLFYDPKNDKYLKIDEDLHEEEVVIIDEGKVFIKSEYLYRYSAARQMYLGFFFSARSANFHGFSGYTDYFDIYEDNFVAGFSGSIGSDANKYVSFSGKHIIKPEKIEQCGYYPFTKSDYDQFEEFIIDHDKLGHDIISTCDPQKLNNYFTHVEGQHFDLSPVFFSREVLQKYYRDIRLYEICDGMINKKGSWYLRYNNCENRQVISVYLGDLGKSLPYKEQKYWKSFNIYSDTKIDETGFRRDFLGEWIDSEDPVERFKNSYNDLQKEWNNKAGWPLFLPLEPDDLHYYNALHIPVVNNQSEFDEQILAITKITNDSINKKSLRPYLEHEIKQLNEEEQKNIGSIKLLSMFWEKNNLSQYEQNMTLMQNIQSVRSQGTAHRKSKKDYEKKAKDIGVTDNNFQEVISNILNNLADFFILIQNNIDNITF